MKKLLSVIISLILAILYCVNVYAGIEINEGDISIENENSVTLASLDTDYIIRKYDLVNKIETSHTVDFSALTTMTLDSTNGENFSCEPYTPISKTSGSSISPQNTIGEAVLTSPDETISPFCKIVYIICVFDGVGYRGTGVILGPDLVLTCGHVVYDLNKGYPDDIYIYTEKNANSCHRRTEAISVYVDSRCKEGDGNYDWGIIRTQDLIGNEQGWMGFSSEAPSNCVGMDVTVAGYPRKVLQENGTYLSPVYDMMMDTGEITGVVNLYLIYTDVSGEGGMSGAPIFSSDQYVRALFTGSGEYNGSVPISNRGTVITYELFLLLRAAKNGNYPS